jgi:hypothetical protein
LGFHLACCSTLNEWGGCGGGGGGGRRCGEIMQAVLLLGQLVDMFEGVITQTLRGAQTAAARRDVVFAERLNTVRDFARARARCC